MYLKKSRVLRENLGDGQVRKYRNLKNSLKRLIKTDTFHVLYSLDFPHVMHIGEKKLTF
jgi:hypothetical protein